MNRKRAFFKITLSFLLMWVVTESTWARTSLRHQRAKKAHEAKHLLKHLEKKVSLFERMSKKVVSGGESSGLPSDQIDQLKNWVRAFAKSYHKTHETLLDAEDRVHFLDRKIEKANTDRYLYNNLSANRLQVLGKIGNKYTQQKVEFLNFLENERDSANRQLSDSSTLSTKRGGGWGAIRSLMTESLQGPSIPPFSSPRAVVKTPPRKAKQRVAAPKPARRPAKLPFKKAPLPQIAKRLPTKRKGTIAPPRPIPTAGAKACSSLPWSHLDAFRDGASDFQSILEDLGTLNTFATTQQVSDQNIDQRYQIYSKVLPYDFLAGKFPKSSSRRLPQKIRDQWEHLKYLARVRLIHIYDSTVEKNTQALFSAVTKKKMDDKWSKHFFSRKNSRLVSTQWIGRKSCKSTKLVSKARSKCKLLIGVRHGQNLLCRPGHSRRGLTTFNYLFQFDSTLKRWVLGELYLPETTIRSGQFSARQVATFETFRKKVYAKKETVVTLETWVQKGVPTSDLIGFDEFLREGPSGSRSSREVASKKSQPVSNSRTKERSKSQIKPTELDFDFDLEEDLDSTEPDEDDFDLD